jgi:hypothetical protein
MGIPTPTVAQNPTSGASVPDTACHVATPGTACRHATPGTGAQHYSTSIPAFSSKPVMVCTSPLSAS